jgi:hypothetical protein
MSDIVYYDWYKSVREKIVARAYEALLQSRYEGICRDINKAVLSDFDDMTVATRVSVDRVGELLVEPIKAKDFYK